MHKNVNINYLKNGKLTPETFNRAKYVCLKDLFTHILEHFTVIALSELCCKRRSSHNVCYCSLIVMAECVNKF